MAGELEVANLLVELADVRTLMMPRKSDKSNDGKVDENTNTALHDAVAYKRCLVQECTCPSDDSCPDRIYFEEQMYMSRERILKLVQLLIQKAPGALSATNANVYTRSEEHTSELQSQLTISYAVFCLKKKFF